MNDDTLVRFLLDGIHTAEQINKVTTEQVSDKSRMKTKSLREKFEIRKVLCVESPAASSEMTPAIRTPTQTL